MDKRVTLYTSTSSPSARWQNVVVGNVAATTSTAINSSRILLLILGDSPRGTKPGDHWL
jgi:hypothetical protein